MLEPIGGIPGIQIPPQDGKTLFHWIACQRMHEPNLVPERRDLTRPMMRRMASLDANQRRLKTAEQPQHLGPAQFAPQCRLASLVDAVHLEHASLNRLGTRQQE